MCSKFIDRSSLCNTILYHPQQFDHFYIDDSIAGTTSSQIIHDTVADFTSQWQMASKPVSAHCV